MNEATTTLAGLPGELAAIIGERYVLTDPADMASFLAEPRELFHGHASCIVRPGSTEEVSQILKACSAAGVSVVPQGGNTGLVGGQIPGQGEQNGEVVLSLGRMNRLRESDAASMTMTVEAGMTLAEVQANAEKADALFPLSLASEGSCTIGGNLATNAGGTAVLAYGNARDLVTGLEVVLADGRVLSNLSKLKKDNTGYDLKHLFMGSEGTLGIITAAVVKLYPRPRAVQTAFVGLKSPADALALLNLAQARAGNDVKTFELMARFGLEIVLNHASGVRDPLNGKHDWYVLLELGSQMEGGLEAVMMTLLEEAAEQGIIEDATIASSLDQRRSFWKLREDMSDMQKHEGGSIKHDISVAVALVPQFLEEMYPAVEKFMPGARPCPFGHLGDGNIHCNITQPVGMDKQAFLDQWYDMNEVVHSIVTRLEGSISAEHGIGTLKRDLLPQVKNPVAMGVMRSLKAALDPKGILNPGKVLQTGGH